MDAYRKRTGERLTYGTLSKASGLAISTLQSMAVRPGYNTRLSTVEKLCNALKCQPGDLLELTADDHGSVL
jgi:DNA-binding Xre family transcriptional regulator